MQLVKFVILLLTVLTVSNTIMLNPGIAQSIPLYGYVSTTVYTPSDSASTTDEPSRPPDAFAAPVAIPETNPESNPKTFSQ